MAILSEWSLCSAIFMAGEWICLFSLLLLWHATDPDNCQVKVLAISMSSDDNVRKKDSIAFLFFRKAPAPG